MKFSSTEPLDVIDKQQAKCKEFLDGQGSKQFHNLRKGIA